MHAYLKRNCYNENIDSTKGWPKFVKQTCYSPHYFSKSSTILFENGNNHWSEIFCFETNPKIVLMMKHMVENYVTDQNQASHDIFSCVLLQHKVYQSSW